MTGERFRDRNKAVGVRQAHLQLRVRLERHCEETKFVPDTLVPVAAVKFCNKPQGLSRVLIREVSARDGKDKEFANETRGGWWIRQERRDPRDVMRDYPL